MSDLNGLRIIAHRKNIARYRRLLGTPLTVDEHRYLEWRISEEEAAIAKLIARERSLQNARTILEHVVAASGTPPSRGANRSKS